MRLTLSEVIEALGARRRENPPRAAVAGVSTDSRTLATGELFFALVGPTFDGHAFVAEALQRGAAAAVVAAARVGEQSSQLAGQGVAAPLDRLIAVDDPLAALGRLAAYHRRAHAADVIAVVGSNGKTTTKSMIAHVLSGGRRVHCSPRSFNNAIGVPLTLLSVEPGDEVVVVEIGTNAPGEVAALGALARPDMAVITSIAEEHLEGLGDLAGVAAEEASILASVRRGGLAAVNIDSPEIAPHLAIEGVTLATFGRAESADLRLTNCAYEPPWLRCTYNGRFACRLPVPGAHNALNAAGAMLIARRMNLEHAEIAARLETFAPPPMRSAVRVARGITIIDDTYNANPGSARAAIEMLAAFPCRGRRVLVIGEMRELGAAAAAQHEAVARRIAQSPIDRVVLVGAAGEWMAGALAGGAPQVALCDDPAQCATVLHDWLTAGDVVLLKASRAVALERAVAALLEPAAATEAV